MSVGQEAIQDGLFGERDKQNKLTQITQGDKHRSVLKITGAGPLSLTVI